MYGLAAAQGHAERSSRWASSRLGVQHDYGEAVRAPGQGVPRLRRSRTTLRRSGVVSPRNSVWARTVPRGWGGPGLRTTRPRRLSSVEAVAAGDWASAAGESTLNGTVVPELLTDSSSHSHDLTTLKGRKATTH